MSGLIFETGRPGRVENYAEAPGEAAEAAREMGWRSSVGAPITVEGRLWGALAVVSKSEQPLPPDTERRLAEFAELFATAIANSEAHEQLARLADEQAALRRVATLVAEGATSAPMCSKPCEPRWHRLFGADARRLHTLRRQTAPRPCWQARRRLPGPIGRSWPARG